MSVMRMAGMLCSLAAIPAIEAHAVVIDFESVTGMSNAPGAAIPAASQLSTQYLSQGVRFNSVSPFAAVVNIGGPGHATSGVNAVGGADAVGNLSYSALITASFSDPANPAVDAVTDSVSIHTDLIGSGLPVFLRVYDVNGIQIGFDGRIDTVAGGALLHVVVPGIHSITVQGNGTSAFDDLTFNPLVAVAPTQLAEPATLALVAITLLPALAHRRRRYGAK